MTSLTAPYAALTPSANSASSFVMKALAGGVDFFQVNTGATAGYVMLHDAAAAPSNGAVTPLLCIQVAANSTVSVGLDPPLKVTTGAVLTFSTTGPTTLTLSATAWFSGRMYSPQYG